MSEAVRINKLDMVAFLKERGFSTLHIPHVKELVMGKVVAPGLCLRVYTTIEGEFSRCVAQDAIRVVLFTKVSGEVKLVGADRRVHRVVGWKWNLEERLNNWRELLGPACPRCGALTMKKKSPRWEFWGCVNYPQCNGSVPVCNRPEPVRDTSEDDEYGPPPRYEDEFEMHMAMKPVMADDPGNIFDLDGD